MRNVSVERVMTPNPATIRPFMTVGTARNVLEFGDLHHLPVVDEGRLVGIVSTADLLKLYLIDDLTRTPTGVKVSSIMVTDPVTLPRSANLRDAAETLSQGGFHALPIVDEDMQLLGIITSTDLNLYLLRHLPRGDGSLREDERPDSGSDAPVLSDADFVDALTALKAAPDDDAIARLARALLAERRPLEDVRKAAELYFRSGQAEREHSVLTRKLAAARGAPRAVEV